MSRLTFGQYMTRSVVEERGITTDACAHCTKHSSKIHGPGVHCSNCLPPSSATLRRCNSCKIVAYCTKDCQRAHWARHRGYCKDITGKTKLLEAATYRAAQVKIWCMEHMSCIDSAVASAMRVAPGGPNTERHACLVHLEPSDVIVDTPARAILSSLDQSLWPALPTLPITIGAARAVPLSEVYAFAEALVVQSCGERRPADIARARSSISQTLEPLPSFDQGVQVERTLLEQKDLGKVHPECVRLLRMSEELPDLVAR
ncbi:hypothetical protein BV25DRAFT_1731770 [Artomyces pyxidatus]|uniref:Uncharacterized protein n=1 Tax=Artomyces pyxidatus TaxID=48021 RepID=A0ACB8SJ72_9AGAM|nr:hypothetical protein BV25DRAFT_1731770 [Artomyces pyxidatus]